MTNWFQIAGISPIYGWGPTKRWIIQGGPDTTTDFGDLVAKARQTGCVYIEIRCFADYTPYRTQLEQAGFVYQPHYDVVIDPQHPVPDAKMRQIKKACAEGYRWREVQGENDLKAWYRKLRQLYWFKIHRPLPRLQWFKQMIYHHGCTLLVVENPQHQIVGGVLLAVEADKSKAYEWYICGQVMSTWAAIDWCRQQGVKCFDTMGAGKPNVPYGVRDFKLQMGGELHEWGRYICVLKPQLYKLGCKIAEYS